MFQIFASMNQSIENHFLTDVVKEIILVMEILLENYEEKTKRFSKKSERSQLSHQTQTFLTISKINCFLIWHNLTKPFSLALDWSCEHKRHWPSTLWYICFSKDFHNYKVLSNHMGEMNLWCRYFFIFYNLQRRISARHKNRVSNMSHYMTFIWSLKSRFIGILKQGAAVPLLPHSKV